MTDQDFLRELMHSLGRIEQKVDDLASRQAEDRRYLIDTYKETNARLGRLEHAESRRKGVTATIASVVGALVSLLVAFLRDIVGG